jgi:hypothetical protein
MMGVKIRSKSRSGPAIALVSSALISILASTSAVRAASCDNQKGSVIFEDTFADDSGGWPSDPDIKIGGGTFKMHMDPKYSNWAVLNNTFNASDADYCMEVVVPKSIAADNTVSVGLIFWATDYDNLYVVDIGSDGHADIYRKMAGKWGMIADLTNPAIKADVGSVAVIRVQAMGNLIAPSINGVDLKKVRAQMPSGALRFGFYTEASKDNPAPGIDDTIKRFRVTDGK